MIRYRLGDEKSQIEISNYEFSGETGTTFEKWNFKSKLKDRKLKFSEYNLVILKSISAKFQLSIETTTSKKISKHFSMTENFEIFSVVLT